MRLTSWLTAILMTLPGLSASHATERAEALRYVHRKPPRTLLYPGRSERRVIVKFVRDSGIRLRNGRLESLVDVDLSAVQRVLSSLGGVPARLMDVPEERVDARRRAAETRSARQIPDLNLYYELLLPAPGAAALCDALNALPLVELAYPASEPAPPPGDIPPETPDFRDEQVYAGPAPEGIDTHFAWHFPGGRGQGVLIIDVEYNWYDNHEDLEAAAGQKLVYVPQERWEDHGTAVLGELIATDDRWGVTGLVPEAGIGMVTQLPEGMGNSVARAITTATEFLGPGDALLLEAQTWGPHSEYVPVEWKAAEYDAIVAATALGIVVVEAAGNGNEDLDHPDFEGLFDRSVRDSLAIIVGGSNSPLGSSPDLTRRASSTYGSRVDLQGWAQSVFTSGYGSAWSGDTEHRQDYRSGFNGTSSASPMVTAAAVAIQGIMMARGEGPLPPEEVRRILVETGTPQNMSVPGHVGPRPNLAAAIRSLSGLLYDSHTVMDDPPDGNGDAVPDPGEAIDLSVCLHNARQQPAAQITARLVNTSLDWLRILEGERPYPDLAPGETGCNALGPYRLVIQPDAPCGESVWLELEISSDLGPDLSHVWLRLGTDASCNPKPCAEPLPGAVPPTLKAARDESDLRLSWQPASGARDYRAWRSEHPDRSLETLAGTPATLGDTRLLLADELATAAPLITYDVRAVNACEWEGP